VIKKDGLNFVSLYFKIIFFCSQLTLLHGCAIGELSSGDI